MKAAKFLTRHLEVSFSILAIASSGENEAYDVPTLGQSSTRERFLKMRDDGF